MKAHPYLLISFCFIIGCASIDEIRYDSTNRNPVSKIDVFHSKQEPEQKFQIIRDFSWLSVPGDEARAVNGFIERAKRIGADGVIIYRPEPRGMQWSGFGGENKFMYKASAIIYQ